MIIKDVLEKSIKILEKNDIDEASLKAKILLARTLAVKKEYLFIYKDKDIEEKVVNNFFEDIYKLASNIPLQYITGEQEFMGIKFKVNENVLIPRCDTEILVEEAIKYIDKNSRVLDICTGSGAIPISIAKHSSVRNISGIDISEKALEIAKMNAKSNDVNVKFFFSNMFENVEGKFNVIVSNPPYIESETILGLTKDVQNEPMLALDGGIDGLDFYRIIAQNVDKYLEKNGVLLLEIGYNQRDTVTKLFESKFEKIECIKDLGGNDRVLVIFNN